MQSKVDFIFHSFIHCTQTHHGFLYMYLALTAQPLYTISSSLIFACAFYWLYLLTMALQNKLRPKGVGREKKTLTVA